MVQCVRVENLTPALCDTEMLELYFEKWGHQVKDCTLIPEEHVAIVTFEESKGKSWLDDADSLGENLSSPMYCQL